MAIVTAEVEIARPLDEVFAFAADRRSRVRVLPDNFTGVRVLTDEYTGIGARFAFALYTDRGAYESVTELMAFDPPSHLVERTTNGGTVYETFWWFRPRDGGTLVRTEMRYEAAGGVLHRLLGRLARKALAQSLLVELLRLKALLERG